MTDWACRWRCGALYLGSTLLALLVLPSLAAASVFSPASVWNKPLGAGAPLDRNSSRLAAELNRQVSRYGTWINTSSCSTPVYTVPEAQQTVRVTLDTTAPALQSDFSAVPLPSDAVPAAGSDHHLTVYQPRWTRCGSSGCCRADQTVGTHDGAGR